MHSNPKPFLHILFYVFLFATSVAKSEITNPHVLTLLEQQEPPEGVVFEIITWQDDAWEWATPLLTEIHQRLKSKFPDLDIAIVSHGAEQFDLTTSQSVGIPKEIANLTKLNEAGVNLHVCGTHSSWQDIPDTAYLDIVDVAVSAPAQINDYIELGYEHIQLHHPHDN